MIGFFIFAFGAIIGSFLNVVIFRLNTGRTPGGRSACLSCGKTLHASELIPIVSYILQRGACKKCGSHISIQYPLVEAGTGLVFLLIFFHYERALLAESIMTDASFLLALTNASLLMVIAVYDLRHKIIPDLFVFLFIGLGVGVALYRFSLVWTAPTMLNWLDLFAGLIFFLFFYSLWRFSNGTWMGLGDGKLALGIGLTLGFPDGLSVLVLAFWIGALYGLLLIILKHVLPVLSLKIGRNAITMKSEIPFAPFLILGMALVFFFHIHVLSLF